MRKRCSRIPGNRIPTGRKSDLRAELHIGCRRKGDKLAELGENIQSVGNAVFFAVILPDPRKNIPVPVTGWGWKTFRGKVALFPVI
jgi:hypothetical protein